MIHILVMPAGFVKFAAISNTMFMTTRNCHCVISMTGTRAASIKTLGLSCHVVVHQDRY